MLSIPSKLDNINYQFPVLRPLNNSNFRLLLLGEVTFLLGNQAHVIVLAWLALQLTGSSLTLGFVLTAAAIPKAVFMLFGGALSDRFALKRLMQISSIARAAIAAGIATLVFYEAIAPWHLYLFALLIGVADALFYPALMTTIPSLLERNKLEAGNALVRGAMQTSALIGAVPAGLLISTIGIAATFGIDAIFFLLATIALWSMAEVMSSESTSDDVASGPAHRFRISDVLVDIKDGLGYAWRKPAIRALFITVSVIHLSFTGPFIVGLATLTNNSFAGGATDFGIVRSCFGGGALLGTIIAGSVVIKHRGLLLTFITAALGTSLALISLSQEIILASLLAGLIGIGNGLFNVISFTWLQKTIAPHMLGRMMGLINSFALILSPISFILTGAIAEVNPSLVFIVAGIPVLLITIYLLAIRDFRQLP
ncbi:MFS transporter [Chloroflexota bacterium]